MLPKLYRLKRKKDFEKILKEGKRTKFSFLVLIKHKNKLNYSRFGFVVPNKVSKKATVRNQIKRRLRSLVWQNFERIQKGIDVILLALPGLENKTYQELEKILGKLFQKGKIIKC